MIHDAGLCEVIVKVLYYFFKEAWHLSVTDKY